MRSCSVWGVDQKRRPGGVFHCRGWLDSLRSEIDQIVCGGIARSGIVCREWRVFRDVVLRFPESRSFDVGPERLQDCGRSVRMRSLETCPLTWRPIIRRRGACLACLLSLFFFLLLLKFRLFLFPLLFFLSLLLLLLLLLLLGDAREINDPSPLPTPGCFRCYCLVAMFTLHRLQ